MNRILGALGSVGLALALYLPAAPADGRDRFPGFVYTSPETIREAQQVLVALRYLKPASFKEGDWDATTRESARDFQRDHFLRPDGRLDRDTLAVLMSHRPRPGKGER
jgi:peptidoglycan hydrolase-like protein with peptidoglycan-binding domain